MGNRAYTAELQNRVVLGQDFSALSGISPVAPGEGAELIRAFLQIEQKSVRAAVIDLVKRLSQANSQTQ